MRARRAAHWTRARACRGTVTARDLWDVPDIMLLFIFVDCYGILSVDLRNDFSSLYGRIFDDLQYIVKAKYLKRQ